jgi:hypothetical protein
MVTATPDRQTFRYRDSYEQDCVTEQTRENVARYASATPQMLDQRLEELSHEWAFERLIAGGSAAAILAGLLLVTVLDTAWLLVPAAFAALLLMQAFGGWSPWVPLLRRMGFRRGCEISHERYALKALRGDFQRLNTVVTPQDREDLARFEGEGGAVVTELAADVSDPEIVNHAIHAAKP